MAILFLCDFAFVSIPNAEHLSIVRPDVLPQLMANSARSVAFKRLHGYCEILAHVCSRFVT